MRPLKLEQVPLIMMECSLLDTRYGGLPHFPESYAIASRLKQRALQYHGNFSLLWHNSYLQRAEDKKLLSTLLSEDSPE